MRIEILPKQGLFFIFENPPSLEKVLNKLLRVFTRTYSSEKKIFGQNFQKEVPKNANFGLFFFQNFACMARNLAKTGSFFHFENPPFLEKILDPAPEYWRFAKNKCRIVGLTNQNCQKSNKTRYIKNLVVLQLARPVLILARVLLKHNFF